MYMFVILCQIYIRLCRLKIKIGAVGLLLIIFETKTSEFSVENGVPLIYSAHLCTLFKADMNSDILLETAVLFIFKHTFILNRVLPRSISWLIPYA